MSMVSKIYFTSDKNHRQHMWVDYLNTMEIGHPVTKSEVIGVTDGLMIIRVPVTGGYRIVEVLVDGEFLGS